MKIMLVLTLAACGGGGASTGSTTPVGGGGGGGGGVDMGTLALKNTSSYDIYSIQLSPYDHVDWGANLLGHDPLMHSETAKLAVFDCKKYDLRLVDHDNVECVIQDIDLCFQDHEWHIDDVVLAVCAAGWHH